MNARIGYREKKYKFAQESYLGSGVRQAAVVGAWLGPVVGAECWFEAESAGFFIRGPRQAWFRR